MNATLIEMYVILIEIVFVTVLLSDHVAAINKIRFQNAISSSLRNASNNTRTLGNADRSNNNRRDATQSILNLSHYAAQYSAKNSISPLLNSDNFVSRQLTAADTVPMYERYHSKVNCAGARLIVQVLADIDDEFPANISTANCTLNFASFSFPAGRAKRNVLFNQPANLSTFSVSDERQKLMLNRSVNVLDVIIDKKSLENGNNGSKFVELGNNYKTKTMLGFLFVNKSYSSESDGQFIKLQPVDGDRGHTLKNDEVERGLSLNWMRQKRESSSSGLKIVANLTGCRSKLSNLILQRRHARFKSRWHSNGPKRTKRETSGGNVYSLPAYQLSSKVRDTQSGSVRGLLLTLPGLTDQPQVEAYLGLQYASLLGGELRFMPPTGPIHKWEGVRETKSFGPVCPQRLPDLDRLAKSMPLGYVKKLRRLMKYIEVQTEDCLYLNIYVPVRGTYTIT